jgi:hypothetical protein
MFIIWNSHKVLLHDLQENSKGRDVEREKSQTIRGSGVRGESSRSAGGASVGVVRQRHRFGEGEGRCSEVLGGGAEVGVALPASVALPVVGSAPLWIGLGLGNVGGRLAAR